MIHSVVVDAAAAGTTNRKTRVAAVFLAFALFGDSNRAAAQGTAFTFQGQLLNAGAAANGNYDIECALFTNISLGTQVGGSITNTNVAVGAGLFTTTVDFGANVFTGTSYWLQLSVRPTGSESAFAALSPRQPITPAPYAVYAESAGSLASVVTESDQSGAVTFSNAANVFSGTFSGNGAGLTNVPAANPAGNGVGLTNTQDEAWDFRDPFQFAPVADTFNTFDGGGTGVHWGTNSPICEQWLTNVILIYKTNLVPCGIRYIGLDVDTLDHTNADGTLGWNSNAFPMGLKWDCAFAASNGVGLMCYFMLSNANSGSFSGGYSPAEVVTTNDIYCKIYSAISNGFSGAKLDCADWNLSVNEPVMESFYEIADKARKDAYSAIARTNGQIQPFPFVGVIDDQAPNYQAIVPALLDNSAVIQPYYATTLGGGFYNEVTMSRNAMRTFGWWMGPGRSVSVNSSYTLYPFVNSFNTNMINCSVVNHFVYFEGPFGDPRDPGFTNPQQGLGFVKAIPQWLTRPGVLAIAGDPLQQCATETCASGNDYIWVSQLNNGDEAVLLVNTAPASAWNASVSVSQIPGLYSGVAYNLVEPWSGTVETTFSNSFIWTVPAYSSQLFRIAPALNASALATGTVPTTALPADLGPLAADDGGGLTNLGAANLTGVISTSLLPSFQASGNYDTIAGGASNSVGGVAATVAGGARNMATGDESFAAGTLACATNNNAFVWGDGSAATGSLTNNSVTFRATNGLLFVTGASAGAVFTNGAGQGVWWAPGGLSWNIVSDRGLKERIEPVDPASVLDRVTRLPIAEWNYLGYPQRHIGVMAEDFHALFPSSGTDKTLNEGDLHGVELAAIKGLDEKLERLIRESDGDFAAQLQEKDAEIAALKRENKAIERKLDELRQAIRSGKPPP